MSTTAIEVSASALHTFHARTAVGLEPKGHWIWTLSAGVTKAIYMGCQSWVWLTSHSHPPRMTDFVSHAQESCLKNSLSCSWHLLNYGAMSLSRGLLHLWLSTLRNPRPVHCTEIHVMRRCRQSVSLRRYREPKEITTEPENTFPLFWENSET